MGLVWACVMLGLWQLRGVHAVRMSSAPSASALHGWASHAQLETASSVAPAAAGPDGGISEDAKSPASAVVEGKCWRAGPLEEEEIRRILKRYPAPEYDGRVVREIQREKVAEWVYLPPLPSAAAAREELRRLADLGVEDIAVVTTGPMRDGLSLGLYAEPGGAQRRLAALKAVGVTARIEARYRDVERKFIRMRSTAVPDLVPSWRSVACE